MRDRNPRAMSAIFSLIGKFTAQSDDWAVFNASPGGRYFYFLLSKPLCKQNLNFSLYACIFFTL